MTPMQKYFYNGDHTLTSDFCQEWLQEEKEFAKQCFEAGIKYQDDWSNSVEPNFEQFYKQFEQ